MKLHQSLRLLAKAGPARGDQLSRMSARFHNVPSEYLSLVREGTELELQHESGQYLRIWGPVGCEEMDVGYGISRRIPGAIPIGDDSGGKVLLYMEGAKGKGLYKVGFGDLDRDDAQWLSATLDSFLVDGIGLESFKG